MRPIDLKLRCFTQKESEHSWFAACIDLNLSAQADTSQEARHKLHEMIIVYLQEAFTQDEQYFDDLIPRKAPLYFIFRYYWIWFKVEFSNKFFNTTDKSFTEHLPLVPQLNGR